MMESIQSANNSKSISLIEVSEYEAENRNVDQLISLIEINESEEEESETNKKKLTCDVVKLRNMNRAKRNWRKCLACDENKNLHRPPLEMRRYFCTSQRVYIQKNDRVCDFHFNSQNWSEIHIKKSSMFTSKLVDEMLSLLLKPSLNKCPQIDIGLSEVEFNRVLRELNIPNNPNKEQKKMVRAVKIYLERLRNGHTYEQIAQRYSLNRRTIGKIVKCGRSILLNDFVPNHLGYEGRDRQWLTKHTTDLARILYCNNDTKKCVIILDGTYIYTCNTSNYSHQRKIYSGQKRRHLFKIMKIVSVDGAVIDLFGPFPATINDAEIIKKIFEQTSIGKIFSAGDVVLVDRGFRDSVKYLENKNFVVKIPEFITKGNNNLHMQQITKNCTANLQYTHCQQFTCLSTLQKFVLKKILQIRC